MKWEDYNRVERWNHHYDRGPKKPKVKVPCSCGGDPHEWLEKATYFYVCEVSEKGRITTICFYVDGKASEWWRLIKVLYDKEGK